MFLFREFVLDINKELRASLQKIFGVGWYKSFLVSSKIGLSFPYYLMNINGYNFSILFFLLKGLVVSEVRIKREIESNINSKIELNSYEGVRHKLYLPFVVNVHEQMLVHNVVDVVVFVILILKILKNGFKKESIF